MCWVAITHKFCDQYALVWFPLWENFLFTGLTFLYFTCGVFYLNFDNAGFYAFLYLLMFITGVMYVIFWLLIKFAGIGIPPPVPLESLCGGGGGGSGGNSGGDSGSNNKATKSGGEA